MDKRLYNTAVAVTRTDMSGDLIGVTIPITVLRAVAK